MKPRSKGNTRSDESVAARTGEELDKSVVIHHAVSGRMTRDHSTDSGPSISSVADSDSQIAGGRASCSVVPVSADELVDSPDSTVENGGPHFECKGTASEFCSSYFLPAKIAGKAVNCLVDTGCTANIVSKKAFESFPRNIRDSVVSYTAHGLLADGSQLPVYGSVVLTGKLRSVRFTAEFVVAGVKDDVILGIPFLEGNKCTLQFDDATLVVNGTSLPCTDREGKFLNCKVQVVKPVELAARTEQIVMCRLNFQPASAIGLVEGISRWCKQGVLVAAAVCASDKRQCVPVRVLNGASVPLLIPAGTHLAGYRSLTEQQVESVSDSELECSVLDSESTPMTESSRLHGQTKSQVPEHVQALYESAVEVCSASERVKVADLLCRYADVFSKDDSDVGKTSLVSHSVPLLPDVKPIKQHARRLGPEKEKEVERQVSDLRRRGLIEPGTGAWSSPVVLVRKRDQSYRFCVDYRALNSVTSGDAYPLPRIDESLDALAGSSLFSTLDLLSGYWQIPLDADASEKSAFVTRSGLWQWKVMPFGMTSAPATFERLMETVLRGLQWKSLLLYLDDVIVFSSDVESHITRLEEVFCRLRAANLKLKPAKCELFKTKVKYLGHIVSEEGVATDPEKVSAVRDWPTPGCTSQLRKFLGTVGYYRRFCPGLATVAKPLNALTKKGVAFIWTEECQEAFEELKDLLVSSPILGYPDPELPYVLDTDASLSAAGGVLSQVQDGVERPIAYFSKTFSKPERNYCVTRRELLAVVLSVQHFRPYLYGRKFLLRTDHASLQWLRRRKEPEGQVARWLEILSEFSYDLKHRPGVQHGNADGLSRRLCGDCPQCQRVEDKQAKADEPEVSCGCCECSGKSVVEEGCSASGAVLAVSPASHVVPVSTSVDDQVSAGEPESAVSAAPVGVRPSSTTPGDKELEEAQKQQGDVAVVYKAIQEGSNSLDPDVIALGSAELKKLAGLMSLMKIERGVLKVRMLVNNRPVWCVVCPVSFRRTVVWACHRSAHLGIMKTVKRLRMNWYWPGLTSFVRRQVKVCEVCQAAKTSRVLRSSDQRRLFTGRPWQKVAIDLVGPLQETNKGNQWILVLTDHFTRWQDAIPLPDATAPTVAEALETRVFSVFGIPEEIHTDHGSQFEGNLMNELCKVWGVVRTRSTPYHPQGNSVVERGNRTLGDSLRALLLSGDAGDQWDDLLPQITRVFRATPHSITGETANYLMLGREVRLPEQLLHGTDNGANVSREEYAADLEERMREAHEVLRESQLQTRVQDSDEPPLYTVGDQVLMVSKRVRKGQSKKLQPKFVGPYTVTEVWPNHTYRVQKGNQSSVENEVRLKLFRPSDEPAGQAPGTSEPMRGPNRKGRQRGAVPPLAALAPLPDPGQVADTALPAADSPPDAEGPVDPVTDGAVSEEESDEDPVVVTGGGDTGRPQRRCVIPSYLRDFVTD